VQPQKTRKGHSVKYLVFNGFIRQMVQGLDNQDLEHHDRIIGLCPCIALALLLPKGFKLCPKYLPIHRTTQLLQRVTYVITFFKTFLPISFAPLWVLAFD